MSVYSVRKRRGEGIEHETLFISTEKDPVYENFFWHLGRRSPPRIKSLFSPLGRYGFNLLVCGRNARGRETHKHTQKKTLPPNPPSHFSHIKHIAWGKSPSPLLLSSSSLLSSLLLPPPFHPQKLPKKRKKRRFFSPPFLSRICCGVKCDRQARDFPRFRLFN